MASSKKQSAVTGVVALGVASFFVWAIESDPSKNDTNADHRNPPPAAASGDALPGSGDRFDMTISPGGEACKNEVAVITAIEDDSPIRVADNAGMESPNSYRAVGGVVMQPNYRVRLCD